MSNSTITPTIGNLPGADLPVIFPVSGETRVVNMIVLLAETQMAEQMAKFGFCQAQNMRTIEELDAKYELAWFYDQPVKTWDDAAAVLRYLHGYFGDELAKMRKQMRAA